MIKHIFVYIYFVLIFASIINICATNEEPIIEANICICPSRPHYAGFSDNPWVSGKHLTEKNLKKKLAPDTLLQEIWIWAPGKFNNDKKEIPSCLPVELLPEKEGDSIEIILKGQKFRLIANQKKSFYPEHTFEEMRNYYLNWVKDEPNFIKDDVKDLIKMGVLIKDQKLNTIITGPNNRYFKQLSIDKQNIVTQEHFQENRTTNSKNFFGNLRAYP